MAGKKVTLRSMGAELGVAPATVLRALNNHPSVTMALRRRIVELAQRRHYSLPVHYKKRVAVVIPGFSFEAYTGMILSSLGRELDSSGYQTEIISVSSLEALYDQFYAGVISTVWTAGLEKRWPQEHSVPLVVLNAMSNFREGIYRVTSDEKQGIMKGMDFLYCAGRRRIAFVSTPLNSNINAEKRVEAFHDFCRSRRISGSSFHEEMRVGYELKEIAEDIVRKKADAVFAACESFAPKLLFLLSRRGVRVPDDLSLLAMENPAVTPYTIPPLTALVQDFDELARQCVRLLSDQINRKPGVREILVPYRFIERESV